MRTLRGQQGHHVRDVDSTVDSTDVGEVRPTDAARQARGSGRAPRNWDK
jgi:hypothetical protein